RILSPVEHAGSAVSEDVPEDVPPDDRLRQAIPVPAYVDDLQAEAPMPEAVAESKVFLRSPSVAPSAAAQPPVDAVVGANFVDGVPNIVAESDPAALLPVTPADAPVIKEERLTQNQQPARSRQSPSTPPEVDATPVQSFLPRRGRIEELPTDNMA